MDERQQLIAQAKEKHEREQLIKQARAKWESEQASAEPKKADTGIGAVLSEYVAPVGEFVDKYTGAPTRAALAAETGLKEGGAIDAFASQFGEDPRLAPTGKEIAKGWGLGEKSLSEVIPGAYSKTRDVSGLLPAPLRAMALLANKGAPVTVEKGGMLDPTAAGAAGAAIDVGADWSNVIPVGALARLGGKSALLAGKLGAETAGAVGKGLVRAGDVAMGTTKGMDAVTALEDVAKGVGSRASSMIGEFKKPKLAASWAKDAATAEKFGVDPSALSPSVEFGPNSLIARKERQLAEGAAPELLEKHVEGARQIGDAVERTVAKVGGGVTADADVAGAALRDSFDKAQKSLFENADITYKKAGKFAPGLKLNREAKETLESALTGIDRRATALIERGTSKTSVAQGEALKFAVGRVRAAENYKQAVEALQMLGRDAFPTTNHIGIIPADIKDLQKLYGNLADAIKDTVRKDISPKIADELEANNKTMSEFFKARESIKKPLEYGVADEKLFKASFSDTKKIDDLKKLLPEDAFKTLAEGFIRSNIVYDKDGAISFVSTMNSINKNKERLKHVLGADGFADLKEIVNLGIKHGPGTLTPSAGGVSLGAGGGPIGFLKGIVSGEVDKKTLDSLKARARTGAAAPTTSTPTLAAQTSPGLLPKASGIMIDLQTKRKPVGTLLKGMQSVTPSTYERERQ